MDEILCPRVYKEKQNKFDSIQNIDNREGKIRCFNFLP